MGFFKKAFRSVKKAAKKVKPKKILKKAVDVHVKAADTLKIKEGAKIAMSQYGGKFIDQYAGNSGAFDDVGQGFVDSWNEPEQQAIPYRPRTQKQASRAAAKVVRTSASIKPRSSFFSMFGRQSGNGPSMIPSGGNNKMMMIGGGVGLLAVLIMLMTMSRGK